jgi:lysophospholipase L1-like esterase
VARLTGAVAIAAAAVVSCLTLLVTSAAAAPATLPRPGTTYSVRISLPPPPRPVVRPVRAGGLAGCEQALERPTGQRGAPRLAVVGASFTAGTGPGNPDRAWAVLLAEMLHWDAVIYGVPGAGYVHRGAGHRGPVAAEIARIGLRALAPALVIVQAGHDDIGVPPQLEQQRVAQVIALIRAEAPRARIALVTVFPGRRRLPADYRVNDAIVTAARAADPGVIIMDPLAGGWVFPRARDGLHPTAAGEAWIARKVAGLLGQRGVRPEPPRASTAGPVICDSGIPVRPQARQRPVAQTSRVGWSPQAG